MKLVYLAATNHSSGLFEAKISIMLGCWLNRPFRQRTLHAYITATIDDVSRVIIAATGAATGREEDLHSSRHGDN